MAPKEKVTSKHQEIYQTLKGAIASGQYKAGQRLPSEADLGKTFGASRMTVNRALRELQLGGIIDRRAGALCRVTDHPERDSAEHRCGPSQFDGDADHRETGLSPQLVSAELLSRLSSLATAVGCHLSPRGARMPRLYSSSPIPRTVVIPERLMSSTMPRRSAAC